MSCHSHFLGDVPHPFLSPCLRDWAGKQPGFRSYCRRGACAAGHASVRATLNRGLAREGRPQRNAWSYLGRNRARARPTQIPHADMPVVEPDFALGLPFASLAQEQAAPEMQVSADPIELAAQRVQVWETPGVKWAILSGEAAVIQAGDGLRARAAVVRLTEVPLDDGKGYQAEIYAEGDVRASGQVQVQAPRSRLRTVFRTAQAGATELLLEERFDAEGTAARPLDPAPIRLRSAAPGGRWSRAASPERQRTTTESNSPACSSGSGPGH